MFFENFLQCMMIILILSCNSSQMDHPPSLITQIYVLISSSYTLWCMPDQGHLLNQQEIIHLNNNKT